MCDFKFEGFGDITNTCLDIGIYCSWVINLWKYYRIVSKMNIGDAFTLLSQAINFVIFIFFIVILLRFDVLDIFGNLTSAFRLLNSLLANIISAIENKEYV
jgi:hypothetical protein